ncbi:CAAX protease self-immunity [Terrimicrobium sacchariphilum]|uniref:CAAX protease self-immunity n=1 Tax=Terrimicrobium sacchariphilum TaxID=690879 RepID=A0A146G3H6_TERSA|nr:type II CAAX endopeptidase family protein [Terrimicrobium sacchariphilum]GAT32379.1 CAAX protease self-immunity [Terrimicrobium sacchariphilum]
MRPALKAYILPWLCFAALYGSQVVVAVLAVAGCVVSRGFAYWLGSPWGVFSVTAIGGLAALGVVYLFLRRPSAGEYLRQLGLRFPPRDVSIPLVLLGLALGFAASYLGSRFPAEAAANSSFLKTFANGSREGAYLYAVMLVAGPFLEELVMRGFLYQVFRKGYGVPVSVGALVFIGTLTHWKVATASVWYFLMLALLQVTICLAFEKTKNLWNCIAIHVAYNAVMAYFFLKAMYP